MFWIYLILGAGTLFVVWGWGYLVGYEREHEAARQRMQRARENWRKGYR